MIIVWRLVVVVVGWLNECPALLSTYVLLRAETSFAIAHQSVAMFGSEMMKIHSERFLLSSELGCFSPWLAYLAVKTKDLCTVFTLEFMCYSDKNCGPACVSEYFMSVYWDHRLPTGGHTKHYSVGMQSPTSSQSILYLQHSHMSDEYYPLK